MIRYEIHYETGDSWWWQATEPTRTAAEQRVEELRKRFPTRDWRIQEIDDAEKTY